MFRALASEKTPQAKEVRNVQASGKLISDEMVIKVVRERTARDDCRDGYILDGFPRTTVQAEMLEGLALDQGKQIVAIVIDVPFELLEKRATGRRTCPVCGEIYNIHVKPPAVDNVCDLHPDAELVHRPDDTPEKIRVRLDTYEQLTQPLLDYYEKTSRLRRVDGGRDKETIFKDIENIVSRDS